MITDNHPDHATGDAPYRRGVCYALLAGVFLSSAGILVRYVEHADAWSVLFYRSIAFSVTVLIFMRLAEPGQGLARLRKLNLADGVVCVALGSGFIFYVFSLYHTSVANTVLLLSTGPFFAAIMAWLMLRERVFPATWVAMSIAIAGVLIMVSGDISSDDARGVLYALLAVCAFAIMVVTLRVVGTARSMLLPVALAGVFSALVSALFIADFSISAWDLAMSLCLGSIQVGGGFILITLASRSVPAAQVPLLALGETALAPLWVWLIINEVPATATLYGGAVVIAAVLYQSVNGIVRGEPQSFRPGR